MKSRILGVHHVAIICSDYERSKQFYTKCLGGVILNELYRAERDSYKLDLELPDKTQIELFSFPTPPMRPSYPEARGLRHLAFRVSDLDEVVNEFKSNGIACEPIRRDEITGRRFAFFFDPDGLPLELYEERLGSSHLC